MCILPYLILTVTLCDHGIEQLGDHRAELVSGRVKDQMSGTSSYLCHMALSDETHTLLLASLGVSHEPGNALSNLTYSSKPPASFNAHATDEETEGPGD